MRRASSRTTDTTTKGRWYVTMAIAPGFPLITALQNAVEFASGDLKRMYQTQELSTHSTLHLCRSTVAQSARVSYYSLADTEERTRLSLPVPSLQAVISIALDVVPGRELSPQISAGASYRNSACRCPCWPILPPHEVRTQGYTTSRTTIILLTARSSYHE